MSNSPSVPEDAFSRPQELILNSVSESILTFSMFLTGISASLSPMQALWSRHVYWNHDTGRRNRRLPSLWNFPHGRRTFLITTAFVLEFLMLMMTHWAYAKVLMS